MHEEEAVSKRNGAYLPHWTKQKAIYAVQFRLADSLPQSNLQTIAFEREDILHTAKEMGRKPSNQEYEQLKFLHSEKMEKFLNAGYGACWLHKEIIAHMVSDTLKYFDSKNYKMYAWCIMPNHVHVVLQPLTGNTLSKIIQGWKKFTAKMANRLLKRSGSFWQREYYDHLIRNEKDFWHAIEYTWGNPDKAGFKHWRWRWKCSEDIPDGARIS